MEKNKNIKILTLDSSTSSTGWSLYIGNNLKDYGLINLKKITNSEERVKTMTLTIYDLIKKINPDVVVVELTVVTRNPQVQRVLSMLLGCVAGKCYEKNILFYPLRPTEWRKLVKDKDEKLPRKRDELKLWGINKVKEIFNICIESDDVSDAILIGLAYINIFKGE